jgi:hypothetical protein
MGKFASKLGPITGYWILIIAAIGAAKLLNLVDLNDTMATIKYLAFISLAYIILNAAYKGLSRIKK